MRTTIKILLVMLLLCSVLGAAVYLDNHHGLVDLPQKTQAELFAEAEKQAPTVPQTTVAETTGAVPAAAVETTPETESAEAEAETEPAQQRFQLTFVGDCTLGANPTNYYAGVGFIKTVGEDYGYPFRNVLSYLESDDATFANLEGALTDTGNPADKTHTFRGPASYGRILTQNSVDVVTLANNHSFDYGQTGYDSTRAVLDEAGIPYVKRDSSRLVTLECGLKVGLYGTVYFSFDQEDMKAEIAQLREQGAELVIVAAHWGTEGTYHPTEEQTQLGHAAIDAGADIVWGSHPHVLQPIEEYNGGVIYYSLGNFCFGGNGSPDDMDTALLQQEVIRDAQGKVSLGTLKIVPCSVSSVADRNNFQPTPLTVGSEEYNRALSKLEGTFTGSDLKIHKIAK